MKQILIIVILCATALIGLRIASPKQEAKSTVIEAIHARRSIRKYKDTPVEKEELEQVTLAGIAAPNAMNRQAWAIRVIGSKEWIKRCTDAYLPTIEGTPMGEHLLTPDFKNMFRNAPAVIFVAAEPSAYAGVDCGILAQNMMLAAHELGLGTCCLGSPVGFMNSKEGEPFLASLGLPEGYALQFAIAIGYADEAPEAKPRDQSKIVFVE
ncbi:MAG: nitroreductase [Alistipes sp.]|nr:nitroreductase [Alistipes sp.]